HQAGDRVLKEVSAAWGDVIRDEDVLARPGGDEFGVVLPNCGQMEALQILDRLRTKTPALPFSAGLALWDGTEHANSLMERVGSSAVTVAVRGPSSSRDISPKNEPAGIEPTLRPLIDASAMPSATTKNSSPASPSLVSTVPDGTRRSSATAARRPTSFLLRAENIDTF